MERVMNIEETDLKQKNRMGGPYLTRYSDSRLLFKKRWYWSKQRQITNRTE